MPKNPVVVELSRNSQLSIVKSLATTVVRTVKAVVVNPVAIVLIHRKFCKDTLLADTVIVEAAADQVRVGRAEPTPRPMMATPATLKVIPAAVAIVSACPGLTKITSPLLATHILRALVKVEKGALKVPGLPSELPICPGRRLAEPALPTQNTWPGWAWVIGRPRIVTLLKPPG